MSTEIVKADNQATAEIARVWAQQDNIRKLFAPTLTETEFSFFMELGRNLGANPFKREIWAIKYKSTDPAAIFLGRDFNRRKAQEQAEYDGHAVDAVYSRDQFTVENGLPRHNYSVTSRGDLVGAYCVVYKKGQKQPFFVFVELREYSKPFGNWKSMPATMIKKVAESQGLRGAFQGVFAGTYDESEQWQQPGQTQDVPHQVVDEKPAALPEQSAQPVVVLPAEKPKLTKKEIDDCLKYIEAKGKLSLEKLCETWDVDEFDRDLLERALEDKKARMAAEQEGVSA